MKKITIDPVTRIEGHLKIEVTVDGGVIKDARSTGTMWRGIELILQGRDPRDATQVCQRICGVCPITHSVTSAQCLDSAFGIDDKITDNGRLMRNLILGSNYIQSHILHFYHLTALDYVDIASISKYDGNDSGMDSIKEFVLKPGDGYPQAPFLPRYEGDYRFSTKENIELISHYIKALEIRRKAHEMLAIFGAKAPHNLGIVAGGVTIRPTADKISNLTWRLEEIKNFINDIYVPDVIAVAQKYSDYFGIGAGCKNLLAYGVFELDGKAVLRQQGGAEKDPLKRNRLLKSGRVSSNLKYEPVESSKITEFVKHSWYNDSTTGRHPSEGDTVPAPRKEGAYSWIKSPRYDSKVYEVGPLARMAINYAGGNVKTKKMIDGLLGIFKAKPAVLFSVLGRHAARALECKLVAEAMFDWARALIPDAPSYTEYQIPESSSGAGLSEGPRGALGHWIKIENYKIANYQTVVPTTWNASPRDDQGQPGPIEQALIGTKIKDEDNPFEVVRIVRSFDPCLACAVHLVTLKGNTINKFRAI